MRMAERLSGSPRQAFACIHAGEEATIEATAAAVMLQRPEGL